MKNCSFLIDGGNCFNHPLKHDLRVYDYFQKIETGQGGDYKAGC